LISSPQAHQLNQNNNNIKSSFTLQPNQPTHPSTIKMAKFLAVLLATAATLGLVQAQCTPNAVLCGTTILDVQKCKALLLFQSPRPSPLLLLSNPTDPSHNNTTTTTTTTITIKQKKTKQQPS
jgi:hypothetical protein